MLKAALTYIIGALALVFSAASAAQVVNPEGSPSFGVQEFSHFVVVEVYSCPPWGAVPNAVGHFEGSELMGTLLAHDKLGLTLLFLEGLSAGGAKDQISAVITELRAKGGPFAESDNTIIRVLTQYATKEGRKCPSLQTGNAVES